MCRFGVSNSLLLDNAKQFKNANTAEFYERLGINKNFSLVSHPVEVVNKIIKVTLKKGVEKYKEK